MKKVLRRNIEKKNVNERKGTAEKSYVREKHKRNRVPPGSGQVESTGKLLQNPEKMGWVTKFKGN